MISGLRDWAPHQAPCWAWSLLKILSLLLHPPKYNKVKCTIQRFQHIHRVVQLTPPQGRVAVSVSRACDSWAQGQEFKPHIGRGAYLRKKKLKHFITPKRSLIPITCTPYSSLPPDIGNHESFGLMNVLILHYHTKGILQYVPFCGLLSLSIMFSWFTHFIACISSLFLFIA